MEGLNFFAVFFSAVFTGNILLTFYLGMSSFDTVSRQIRTSVDLGLIVIFVMTFTSVINYFLYQFILIPYNLEYLRYLIFIFVIAIFIQLLGIILKGISGNLYMKLGIFLPIIKVNCAVLGVSLFMVIRKYNFWNTLAYGSGSGVGWFLAIVAMAGIREQIDPNKLPKGLEGAGISLIIAGIMSMAFMGLSGMVNIN